MIGLHGEGLTGAAGVATLLALCTLTPARADVTPEPRWQQVNVRLDVSATKSTCPPQQEVASWVNDLVGREFVRAAAPVELVVQVADAPNNELAVELVALERPTGVAPTRTELRRFQRALSCVELLRATALTISLFAKGPDNNTPADHDASNGAPQSSATESSVASSPEAGDARVPDPIPSPGAASSVDLAGQPAAAQPTPPVSPAPQQVVAQKRRTPAVEGGAPAPANAETDKSDEQTSWRPIVGVGAHGMLGANPGIGVGASALVGIRASVWEWLLRGAYSASTGERLTPSQVGTIFGPTSELAVAACPALTGFALLGANPTLRVCGFAGALWVYARGEGFERDRRDLLMTPIMGLSSELLLYATEALAIGVRLEALVPFQPVRYQVLGQSSGSWMMWSVAPRIALGVEWR